jgi:hypothetical protein
MVIRIWRPGRIALVVLPVVILLVGALGRFVFEKIDPRRAEEYRRMLPTLEDELSLIPILSGDRLMDKVSLYKSTHAYVEETFSSQQPWETLRNYYKTELTRLGWIQYESSNLEVWGKDYGGRVVRYRKGPHVIALQYSGSDPNARWSYALGVSSGLH